MVLMILFLISPATRPREMTESKREPLSDSEDIEQVATKKRKLQPENIPENNAWVPPSITEITEPLNFDSSTYHSNIPQEIKADMSAPVVLGVDEAGRGPVLGPMVYGIAYSLESYLKDLQAKYGFADSKTLKDDKRRQLFQMIENDAHELHRHVGWATTTMTAKDISSGMLQTVLGKGSYNLNEQAHDTTIQLIKEVMAKGVNVTKVFVDTVGPPASYQAKLLKIFPSVAVTVAKKADSIYPIVSTASVVAKVTRDLNLYFYNTHLALLRNHALGSGYPSDPNTSKWLHANVDRVFGWCFGLVRFSWQTAKDSLEKNNAVPVVYEAQCIKEDSGYHDVGDFFLSSDTPTANTGPNSSAPSLVIDSLYYGSTDVLI